MATRIYLFVRNGRRPVGLLAVALSLFLTACATTSDAVLSDIDQAGRAIKKFYKRLDVRTYEKGALQSVVTADFVIFESGQAMNLDRFHDYISHVDPSTDPLSLTEWVQSDIVVASDINSVHASYRNVGRFEHGDSMTVIINWLESAYFVRSENGLKLKFLNVNLVSKSFE